MDTSAARIREKAAVLRQNQRPMEEVVFAEIPDGFGRVVRFSWQPMPGGHTELRIRGWKREPDATWVPLAKVGIHVYLPRLEAFAEAIATAMDHVESDGNLGIRLKAFALSARVAPDSDDHG